MDFYQLLDSGEGERLEKFGKYVLRRPDPQIIWKRILKNEEWEKADAVFTGDWDAKHIPSEWIVEWEGLKLQLKLTPFKHTGVFPEQMSQWIWLREKCSEKSAQMSVLNLFGYTGVASLVAAAAGANVVHVDASRSTIGWARKNQELSGLKDKPIRWILDDAVKFVEREGRRGNKYDGIIMDPPVYGHGPDGEVWQFNKSLPVLLEALAKIISDDPKFVIINAYAISTSAFTLGNVLYDLMGDRGKIETGEHLVKQEGSDRILSTGIWGRWSNS